MQFTFLALLCACGTATVAAQGTKHTRLPCPLGDCPYGFSGQCSGFVYPPSQWCDPSGPDCGGANAIIADGNCNGQFDSCMLCPSGTHAVDTNGDGCEDACCCDECDVKSCDGYSMYDDCPDNHPSAGGSGYGGDQFCDASGLDCGANAILVDTDCDGRLDACRPCPPGTHPIDTTGDGCEDTCCCENPVKPCTVDKEQDQCVGGCPFTSLTCQPTSMNLDGTIAKCDCVPQEHCKPNFETNRCENPCPDPNLICTEIFGEQGELASCDCLPQQTKPETRPETPVKTRRETKAPTHPDQFCKVDFEQNECVNPCPDPDLVCLPTSMSSTGVIQQCDCMPQQQHCVPNFQINRCENPCQDPDLICTERFDLEGQLQKCDCLPQQQHCVPNFEINRCENPCPNPALKCTERFDADGRLQKCDCLAGKCATDSGFPSTPAGQSATIPCPVGMNGEQTRVCSASGTWRAVQDDGCYPSTGPLPNTAFMGTALYSSAAAPSASHCHDQCNGDSLCYAHTYYTSSWCAKFSAVSGARAAKQAMVSDYSTSGNKCQVNANRVVFDVRGAVISQKLSFPAGRNAHLCCDACHADPQCVAWNYKWKGKCVLMSSVDEQMTATTNTWSMSGTKLL